MACSADRLDVRLVPIARIEYCYCPLRERLSQKEQAGNLSSDTFRQKVTSLSKLAGLLVRHSINPNLNYATC